MNAATGPHSTRIFASHAQWLARRIRFADLVMEGHKQGWLVRRREGTNDSRKGKLDHRHSIMKISYERSPYMLEALKIVRSSD
jgi:hypothetical protein